MEKLRTGTQRGSYKGLNIQQKTRCASAVLVARCSRPCKPVFPKGVVSELATSSRPNASTVLVANRPSAFPGLPSLMLLVFFLHLLHFVLHSLLNVTAGQKSPRWRSAEMMCCAVSGSWAPSQSRPAACAHFPFVAQHSAATEPVQTSSAHALPLKMSRAACQQTPSYLSLPNAGCTCYPTDMQSVASRQQPWKALTSARHRAPACAARTPGSLGCWQPRASPR